MAALLNERYRLEAEKFASSLGQSDEFDLDFEFDSELLDVNAHTALAIEGTAHLFLHIFRTMFSK